MTAADIPKWEKTLSKLTEEGAETSKVLNVVERILSVRPDHVVALRCKVVCCIYQEKFGTAISVLDHLATVDRNASDRSPALRFQRGYCLYRMKQYAEAKAALTKHTQSGGSSHVPSQHLLAQIHYNLEEFEAAAAVYEALLRDGAYRDDQEKTELTTNYTAALSACDPKKAVRTVREAEEKTFDLWYNAAVAQIEERNYAEALKTLQQAESQCAKEHPASRIHSAKEALEMQEKGTLGNALNAPLGGATPTAERRFFSDVGNVWVQMAFVQYALHQEEAAQRLLQLILASKSSSVVTAAVASINWTAIQRSKDIFDSQKKLRALQNPRYTSRLTSKQALVIRYNSALLYLHAGSLNAYRRVVELMAKEYPDSELTHSLKLVLAVRDSKKKKQADIGVVTEYLKQYEASVGKRADSKAAVQLIAAQIFLEHGDIAKAIEALQSSAVGADIAQKPATAATVAAWKVQIGDVSGATSLLQATVATAAKSGNATTAKALLVWAVHYLATSRGLYKEAAELIRATRTASLEKDKEVTAMLALCLSYCDLPAARECMKQLETSGSGAGLSSSAPQKFTEASLLELEKRAPSKASLEDLGYRRATTVEEGGDGKAGSGGALRRRRPRVMRRPPRSKEGKPDPERWLPISIRSYIKDLPERRKRELKRLRAIDQDQKRRAAVDRKKAAAAESREASPPPEGPTATA